MTLVTDDEIVALFNQYRGFQEPIINRMREIAMTVNGEVIIPLPDMDRREKPAVANLLKQALDQMSMKATEVGPLLTCPPVRAHIQKSIDESVVRTKAVYGWWEANHLGRLDRQRGRYLLGYGQSPVVIRPDMKLGIPRWDIRNPMGCYTSPTSNPGDMLPEITIFTTRQPLGWVKRMYPDAYPILSTRDSKMSDMVDLYEYNSAEETVLLAAGQKTYSPMWQPQSANGNNRIVRLDWFPNLAKRPRVVVPGRITLDKPMGLFDGILPMYHMAAKMMALQVIATERGIYPDMYIEAFPNQSAAPVIVSGDWQDGRSGEINIVTGGSPHTLDMNPGVYGTQVIDRIQGAMMQEASIPAEFGGLSPTNVRTNARGLAVTGTTIDSTIRETQDILGDSKVEENKIAIAVSKAWFGNQKKSFYVSQKGFKGQVDYVPNEIFVTDNNDVSYPMSGTDMQNLIIGIESRVGAGLMSHTTGRFLDPLVDDPTGEGVEVTLEALDQTALQMMQQMASQGQLDPDMFIHLFTQVMQNQLRPSAAFAAAHDEMQKKQAAAAQTQPAAAAPGEPAAPETQPGMAPGAGVGAQPPVAPLAQGSLDVSQILSKLRQQHA